jgi:predicted DCC family thiol-disulfide oxidoreductase YuxK
MMNTIYPLTLFYESACLLCDAEVRALRARDRRGRLRFIDVSAPGVVPPPGATRSAMLAAIHGLRADGQWVRGMEAVHFVYAGVGLGWLTAPTRWPLLRAAADRAYAWFARHRHALPNWIVRATVSLLTHRAPAALARDARDAAARAHCSDGVCSR